MKYCFLVLTWLVFEIQTTSENREIDKFLEIQSRIVKEKLNKRIRSNRATELNNIEEKILGTFKHECKSKVPKVNIFSLLNATFVKIDEEVFKTVFNKSFYLEFYADFPYVDKDIAFFKAADYNNFGVIVVGLQTGDVKIYRILENDNKFERIETIQTNNVLDGQIFTNHGNLYLLLATSDKENLGYTSIYKWMGTYFDELETSFIKNAVKIATFAYKTSEIIIILQENSGRKAFSCVYEFKNDKLKKIQLLKTEEPYHIDTFAQNGQKYAIIYEKSKKNSLYSWNGYSLQEISTFHWDKNIAKSTIIVYSNWTPLIVKPELEKVAVYRLYDKTIKLEYTKEYVANNSVILDVNKGRNENGNITFIAALSEDNIININATSFRVLHPQMAREEDRTLRKCFINLEEKLYDERKRLNQTKKPILPILNNFHEDPTKPPQKRNTGKFIAFPSDETAIESKLVTMRNRLDKLKPFIINQKNSINDLVFNEKATIKTLIASKTVKAKHMIVKSVNDVMWTPQNWLRYRETQTVKAPVKFNTVKANILVVNPEKDTFFKNLVTNKGNITFTGKVSVDNLTAHNIIVDKINNILTENIAHRSKPITGRKFFNKVQTQNAKLNVINNRKFEDLLRLVSEESPKTFEFSTNVTIKDLWVETIDGVNWENFTNSVFKVGEDSTIKGNLLLPEIKTEQLKVQFINGVRPEDLLTKTTDQTINSTIEFNNIEATKIEVNTVNDILVHNIAISGQNNVITGPVIIDEIYVIQDLELVGNIDKSFFYQKGRLIGTNESDLKQIYTGKVVINGNLYVKNLNVDPNADFEVNGTKVTQNFFDEYWSQSKNQTISVHFEATEGISVPHLETTRLNNINISNFALNNKDTILNGPLYFERVIVNGNVVLNETEKNFPNLELLEKEGVKKDGTYIIKGKKVFKNNLIVENLSIDQLNGINMYDAITIKNSNSFDDPKVFKTLVIQGNLTTNLTTYVINGIELERLKENAIYTNKPQNLTKLDFKNVTVENLYVKTINGYNITTFIDMLHNIMINKEISNLKIHGNTTISNMRNISTINSYDINEILDTNNETEPDFVGDIKFLNKVKINNLIAPVINNIDFPELTQRLLYKTSNQTVTAMYTFKNLKVENLYTSKINGRDVENLIDKTSDLPQDILAPRGIIFQNITLSSLKGFKMLPCDINNAVTNIKYPKTQKWEKIRIFGNVTLLDRDCDLYRILHKSVRVDQKNVITAPVQIAGNLLAENVETADSRISNINLKEIVDTALLNFAEDEQIVTGHKTFSEIHASNVIVLGNADIPFIVTEDTDIIVPDFYKMIVTKDKVNNITITGTKTFFAGLQTNRFTVPEIMGIKPESIVTLSNLSQIPNVVFDSLEVTNNLSIKFVNNKNLSHIFENRLLLNASKPQIINAVYFFENLEVKDLETPSINNVPIKDVVFDVETQNISAPKTFLEDINIIGNTTVDFINNVNITKVFENSILLDQNNFVNGSLNILKPSKVLGNITTYKVNGFPIKKIVEIMTKISGKNEAIAIYNIQTQVKEMLHKYMLESQYLPNEFLYIEKSSDVQISVPNANDARITKTKDYVLIHVTSVESPEKCNLPEGCKCLAQQTIEITPEKSVSYFLNKAQQRIYSYDDETMTVHFITNSVSRSTQCRTNQTHTMNEISTLTWSTANTATQNGSFNYYPSSFAGYISGVEFFTINGKTYGVIARYYDRVLDSFNLDCTVIKFSEDKTSVTEIQKIPTQGVEAISILHTAQGILLIIGNTKNDAFTEIYRFHEGEDKFLLLRSIAYGCTKTVGVVLGTDSLIILANENKHSPLQVLKYHPAYDNYYYYQLFTLEEPVVGMSVFYIGGFGISDAYLSIVTEGKYRIYSFQYIDGWKLESQGNLNGLRNLIPFEMGNQLYLFAPSSEESMLLTVVKHGAGGK